MVQGLQLHLGCLGRLFRWLLTFSHSGIPLSLLVVARFASPLVSSLSFFLLFFFITAGPIRHRHRHFTFAFYFLFLVRFLEQISRGYIFWISLFLIDLFDKLGFFQKKIHIFLHRAHINIIGIIAYSISSLSKFRLSK